MIMYVPVPHTIEANCPQVFLVDDSASMYPYWKTMKEFCKHLMYVVKAYDKNGVDLYFTVSRKEYNSKKSSELINYVPTKPSTAECDMEAQLGTILHGYADKLRSHRNMSPLRPTSSSSFLRKKKTAIDHGGLDELNVYVLTAGIWQEQTNVRAPIEALVTTMMELNYPKRQVGIQFIRFGNDPEAIETLQRLDDGLDLPMYVSLLP